ncbi:Iodotyrosine dehalogenase 1 Short=IYD-1 [Fibrisoma limi BUZ 3]|uniref:Iodotyrosine dehalogenase 1 Short=IYD-1 n=1 Tax=Fibrisoma limi BUZ 3 TaxID=1185876 RepID=I2GLM6_9BACT|nr:nitroreductase family protein [Fibrisoma limi]CCH54802.1 Iodotyrosine dehalogenase 1 Short=IYD-1 [Fibrisoma limi BUZ 3]
MLPYQPPFIPTDDELLSRSRAFYEHVNRRRTVRDFSDRPVPREVIEQLIMAASTAPSGANKQPWTFCVVGDPGLKQQIREAAEAEEYRSYNGRMSPEWLADLAPLGTDWRKTFLETAPWLIVVFRRIYEPVGDQKRNNYYVMESVGLACGFLLAAIHDAGLVALTHTPSPMDFLTKLLERPANEKPFLLIPVGYPAPDATVPDIQRKPADQVIVWY